jgi:hypothetical protein
VGEGEIEEGVKQRQLFRLTKISVPLFLCGEFQKATQKRHGHELSPVAVPEGAVEVWE